MNYLEIIEVRMAHDREEIEEHLKSTKDELKSKKEIYNVQIFVNCHVETDFSIHIHYETGVIMKEESALGSQLAYSLKDYGLVNHSLWKENICIYQ